MTDDLVRRILNEVERRELPLLTWGVTDGTLTEAELEAIISTTAPNEDPDEILDEMLQRRLIASQGLSDKRYRSRMAETVRLATTLRQWFHGRPWITAPELVSDSRFLSRPRVVPRRDRSTKDLSAALRETLGVAWTDKHQGPLDAILGDRKVSDFQARATIRLLKPMAGPQATMIAAGTGAGKTLSFYLPVLTHLLATDKPSGTPRVLAIYPRTELLRDQLRALLSTIDDLSRGGHRAPTVGVLYGAVPISRADAEAGKRGWTRRTAGLVCPILDCLMPNCTGSLIWSTEAGDSEVLDCDKCGYRITGDRLHFTRRGLQANPPEVLFTTTEMLNRQLGSTSMRRLLVGTSKAAPEYILLDEVHTYSGTHGAQVANLLRRWRSELSAPPHIVGLSATLSDPVGFFADLVGLPTSGVGLIAPASYEMQEIGREYFLALRGDPASQASLLSTTIQTAMLLRRMLDPAPREPSQGTFGSRVFVFTDDLDVTNRLHSQLEDAEGWQPGGTNRKPGGSLATLRASSTSGDTRARESAVLLGR